ncbi:hypothetical protein SERLA73DRAFT_183263 [Serpula lacrymans var. lacrymans S7.3]|uniref:DUF6534 domain-containing protein n=2 Tax=Serpula lacrymans var. lacrymans TaxID=341189 RepID=F8PZJ4_SERL3|nr:uncharacterized protein SERLADRAFT_470332 [Serpula lacrymans var. lacrymans S7.9]EGN98316.1 hypothetical protein SERLA73DRAFT_183263 [Serpula lacrymans var. lacrymans S7.3]EGO23882.1 hypothetical protein SERLADRAFT_470332 [Serpula lacrymans var. lacrymans S7.9]
MEPSAETANFLWFLRAGGNKLASRGRLIKMALGPAEVAHGPFLIGVILNVALYGIMITQTFLYFTTYKKDRLWMKFFVSFLFIADTVNAVFDIVYIYDSLVVHFGDDTYLATANWVFGTDPAMTGIIGSMVQAFFAWRVYIISRNLWTTCAILGCAAAGCLCSIGTSIGIGIVPQFIEFQKFQVVVIIWLVCAALGDVLITISLVWHLNTHKTGFSSTDDVINRIVKLTVQTGFITAVWAVVDLVIYLTFSTGLHLIFNVTLSKLYTNSLMSSLNSRGGWKFTQSSENSTTHKSAHRGVSADVVQLASTARPEVFVHVESHQMVDLEDLEDSKSPNDIFRETGHSHWDSKGTVGSEGSIV